MLKSFFHTGFVVKNLERGFYNETKQRGLHFNNPPAALHDDQGKVVRKALYAQDPDSYWLEFVEMF